MKIYESNESYRARKLMSTQQDVAAGSRQSRVKQIKIPLNLPLQRRTFKSPF